MRCHYDQEVAWRTILYADSDITAGLYDVIAEVIRVRLKLYWVYMLSDVVKPFWLDFKTHYLQVWVRFKSREVVELITTVTWSQQLLTVEMSIAAVKDPVGVKIRCHARVPFILKQQQFMLLVCCHFCDRCERHLELVDELRKHL
jgi:metal-dependent HD superfamily phosphatase/phosphodiesterase